MFLIEYQKAILLKEYDQAYRSYLHIKIKRAIGDFNAKKRVNSFKNKQKLSKKGNLLKQSTNITTAPLGTPA
jgi:hypothetical protein